MPRFRKTVTNLDDNAPEIAKKIYRFETKRFLNIFCNFVEHISHLFIRSLFPESEAEGLTIDQLIQKSRRELSEEDAEETVRNALDIFYEQGQGYNL